MKKVVLCGHTGSINRGSEAIIKSTADLLNKQSIKVILATHELEQDKKMDISMFENAVEYTKIQQIKNSNLLKYIEIEIQDKVFKNKYPMYVALQKEVFKKLEGNIALNVGGDVYCYDTPYLSYALNQYTSKHSIPCYLWGCSIEKDLIDKEMLEDLKGYTMIFPRESITYQTLVDAGIEKEKLFLMADPAFTLEKKEVVLPENYGRKKTVGINLSPLMFKCSKDEEIVWKNIYEVINDILQNTEMDIALIPHVYTENTEDILPLEKVYNKYKETGRIYFFNQFYNCKELKYIISKCSFVITARTHVSIASYSTGVPTLVIGYSVKSKGIAQDLFGTYENYVVPVQTILEEGQLKKAFRWIHSHEEEITQKLKDRLPEMKEKVELATKELEKNN